MDTYEKILLHLQAILAVMMIGFGAFNAVRSMMNGAHVAYVFGSVGIIAVAWWCLLRPTIKNLKASRR